MDKSQPSTNAVSVSNLFRLGVLCDRSQYIALAKATINAFESEILQYPWLFVSLLTGVVAAKLGVKEVQMLRSNEDGLRAYYTMPRGEARVLRVTVEENKAEEKGGSGEGGSTAADAEVKEGLGVGDGGDAKEESKEAGGHVGTDAQDLDGKGDAA